MTDLFPNPLHSYLGTFVVSQLQHLKKDYDITVLVPYFFPLNQVFRSPAFPTFPGLNVIYLRLPAADLFLRHRFGLLTHDRLFLNLKQRAAGALARRASQLHHQHPFNLVHGHETFIGDEAASIGQQLNIPSLITLHSLYDYRLQQIGQSAMSAVLQHIKTASQIIAVSRRALDSYVSHTGPLPHTSIIANGVEPATPTISLRVKLSIPKESLCFLAVGSFTAEKRFTFAIETLAKVRNNGFPNAQLLLVGRGQEEQKLRALATQLQVQSLVHFLGEVAPVNMGAVYATANILLHPSVVESFSMVCLEAMSYGLPVICTDAIGITEFVQPDQDLIVVPADRSELFTAAAISLAGDSVRQKAISQAARRRADDMSWTQQSKLIAELYNTYGRV